MPIELFLFMALYGLSSIIWVPAEVFHSIIVATLSSTITSLGIRSGIYSWHFTYCNLQPVIQQPCLANSLRPVSTFFPIFF